MKLTPAQRKMLEHIVRGGNRGRMLIAIAGSGGWITLDALRSAGLVEANYDIPTSEPDFIRATAAGREAVS